MNLRLTRRGRDASPGARPAGARDHRLVVARAAWAVLALLAVGVFAAGLVTSYGDLAPPASFDAGERADLRENLARLGLPPGFYAGWFTVAVPAVVAGAFFFVAGVIFWRRPDEPMALFASLTLVLFGATRSEANETLGALHPGVGVASSLLESLSLVSVFVFLYLFPDGRFVPRWTRWLVLTLGGYALATSLVVGSPLDPKHWSGPAYTAFFGAWFLTGVFAQVRRYRRASGPVQRQQTKWVFAGFAAALAVYLGMILVFFVVLSPPEPGALADLTLGTVFYCSTLFIPFSIGVAILRYRLWDIDVIINRALVYGALTASLVAIYALFVVALGAVLRTGDNVLVSLLATGLVAVAFAPLRNRLQRGVNRLMYGERDEPYAVLSRLGRRLEAALEPDTVLPTIVETVAGALKLPYVAISIKRDGGFDLAASHGEPTGEQTVMPLHYAGEQIGELILAPRAPGEPFGAADRRLLEDIARNAEAAVHAVRLTGDLRRSRERLVTAREEERRRLRRDLHDGLGPTLASLSLGLDVSMKLLRGDEAREAEEMLFHLKAQTKDAVVDIRRLVYGLRPPALDDLGLVPAIREQAANHGRLAGPSPARQTGWTNGLELSVEAEGVLPPLPAAVEVAAYRIAQEAMTNVARHAGARSCRVRLSVDEVANELLLEVSDDGAGLPEGARAGVGMNSMRERAEELGGTLSVGRGPEGGTRVLARLPLFGEEGASRG